MGRKSIPILLKATSPEASKQASKQAYLFVNAGRYMGSYTADVDLRLDAPRMTF